MTNCIPLNDSRPHTKSQGCWCGPRVEWINPATNLPLPDAPLLIHHSEDCREQVENLLGEGLDDKPWAITHD